MKKNRWHIIFWVGYFLFCYLSDLVLTSRTTFIVEIIVFLTNNIFLFYTLSYLFRIFSLKNSKSTAISFISIFFVFGFYIVFRYFVRYYFLATIFDKAYGNMPLHLWAVYTSLWIVNWFFITSAYYYFDSSLRKQRELNKSSEEKLQLDKRNLELENTLLRAQINPHFLYNSLNFLYANALPLSPTLSEAILKLSDIMRYSIRPQDTDGLVTLSDEAEHISNVIEMAKLRFSNKIAILLKTEGDFTGIKIIPLALITLVENVLKHADLNDPLHPATICIGTAGKNIAFATWNKKRLGPKEFSTGIGLKNTVQRLKDAYKDTCTVTISDEAFDFAVDVRIDNQGVLTT